MANYNMVTSGSGGAMYRVTDTEAFFIGMGIPPVQAEDLDVMYTSRKNHMDDIKSDAKAVGKYTLAAMNALRNNDLETYNTYKAVVQTIIHSRNGQDYVTLMREAYKVEAFTQYEKMLVDQAMKDWAIKDVIVDTGVNE
jgi:hypothetical protein